MSSNPILVIDVAHPPRHPDIVEEEIAHAWTKVRNSSDLKILKIIHGHGSTGKGGTTKVVVRNWAFHHRGKFKGIINGEDYSLFDSATQNLRRSVGAFTDSDLDKVNAGITIVWIKE